MWDVFKARKVAVEGGGWVERWDVDRLDKILMQDDEMLAKWFQQL